MVNFIKDRWDVLKANTVNSYRAQTAYFFDNWSSLASTFLYTVTTLLFIKILYSNVTTFAGYSENEMIFLMLICQLSFYINWIWDRNNVLELIESVRTGELDLILSKPVPSLFFVTFRNISLVNRVKDAIPCLIIMASIIRWDTLHISLFPIFCGVVIFISGLIAWHCFSFLFALPAFFLGQSYQLYFIAASFADVNNIPLEAFTGSLRKIFISLIPSLITAQMTTSVMLGKSDPLIMTVTAVLVATVFLMLKHIGWIICLKNYSSASS
jgi:ABC-2 type transport system permease protein